MWLGAYGIWKWSDEAASKVTVRDTIFRLDMPSYSSCSSQEWPAGTYENVTVGVDGQRRYRSRATATTGCRRAFGSPRTWACGGPPRGPGSPSDEGENGPPAHHGVPGEWGVRTAPSVSGPDGAALGSG